MVLKMFFLGGNLEIRDQYSFDFPEINSQEEWQNFLIKFWKDSEEFANLVEKLPEEKLAEAFVNEKYGSYLRNIDGMIEHCYYHLAQIVLIKKIFDK